MTPTLEAALAECDDLGITLSLNGNKVAFRGGDGLPESLRIKLVSVRPELLECLQRSPLPDPDPVLFVSRGLDVYRVPFFLARVSAAVYVATRPYYRLTPRVWHWLCLAVDRRAEASVGNLAAIAECQAAASLLAELGLWIDAHYRPDQIRLAVRLPPQLPDVPPLPKWVSIDHQACGRAKQTKAVPDAARPTPVASVAAVTITTRL